MKKWETGESGNVGVAFGYWNQFNAIQRAPGKVVPREDLRQSSGRIGRLSAVGASRKRPTGSSSVLSCPRKMKAVQLVKISLGAEIWHIITTSSSLGVFLVAVISIIFCGNHVLYRLCHSSFCTKRPLPAPRSRRPLTQRPTLPLSAQRIIPGAPSPTFLSKLRQRKNKPQGCGAEAFRWLAWPRRR